MDAEITADRTFIVPFAGKKNLLKLSNEKLISADTQKAQKNNETIEQITKLFKRSSFQQENPAQIATSPQVKRRNDQSISISLFIFLLNSILF
jgi:hypothetical protein